MTDYYCRDDGDDGDDGLSDANAVNSPSVLESLLSSAGDRGRFNRNDNWTHTIFGSALRVALSTAGSGTAEASRTRIDAYGSGNKPVFDWEWDYPGDFVQAISLENDYQRATDIEVRNVGPEFTGSNVGGGGCGTASWGVLSPEFYNIDVDGCFRSAIVIESYLGSGVIDGCTVTYANLTYLAGYDWGGACVSYRTMNSAVTSGTIRNCTVHEQFGEAVTCTLTENYEQHNNWCWGNRAAQFYMQCSRNVSSYLNRGEGTTDTTFHRYDGACGAALGYDIEPWESTSRAQQADDGNIEYYLCLASYTTGGIYWGWGHPDAGNPINVVWEHITVVDCNSTFENYDARPTSSGCFIRCVISMPLSSGGTHDVGAMHEDVQCNYNYWDTTRDGSPHSTLQGPNDEYGTSHVLNKTTGWRSTAGTLVATDYMPQARLEALDLGYDRDFDTTSITMDEFGAFLAGEGGGGDPGPGGPQHIRVERHIVNFGASADSTVLNFTEAGTAANRVWPHLRNVRFASGGPSAGTTSQEDIATLGVYISNITASSLTLTRHSSGTNADVRCYVEVWFYDGDVGGANEFIVRWSGTASMSGTDSTTQSISSVTDAGDLVAESLGQISDAAGGYAHFCRLSLSGTTTLTFKRENSTGDITAAGIVVEMLGSNWQVEEVSHTFSAWNTNETETISSISNWNTAFVISSFEAFDDENNELGCIVWQGASATQVRFLMQSSTASGSLGVATAFVVRNASMSVDHYDSVTGGSSTFAGTTDPGAQTAAITPIADLDTAGIVMHGIFDDSSFNGSPDGWFNYRLSDVDELEIWRSWADGTIEWAAQVIDFSAMADSGSTSPILGSTTFTFSVSGAFVVSGQMSGSTQFAFSVLGALESPTGAVLTPYAGSRAFNYAALGLDSDAVELVVFAFMDFEGEPSFIHSGVGVLTWANEDWFGLGNFGSVEAINDSMGVGAPSRLRLTLVPVAAEYLNSAVNEKSWGRVCELYLGAVNSEGQLVGTPELMIRGLMGAPEAVVGGDDGAVSIVVEDVRSLLNRSNGLRATTHDHQQEAPNDMFYQWLPKMTDHKFIFNGTVQGSKRIDPPPPHWNTADYPYG